MKITDLRFLEGDGKRVLARVTVVFDDMFAIHGLAVMPWRNGGFFLSFPRHEHRDGSSRDTAHPINAETRAYIERKVFDAYREALTNGGIAQRAAPAG